MKKLLAFLLALSLLLALAACGEGETPAAETEAPASETPVEEDGVPPDPEEDDEPEDPLAEPDDPGEIYEEPEEELTGLWYCSFGETNLCLELEGGGRRLYRHPAKRPGSHRHRSLGGAGGLPLPGRRRDSAPGRLRKWALLARRRGLPQPGGARAPLRACGDPGESACRDPGRLLGSRLPGTGRGAFLRGGAGRVHGSLCGGQPRRPGRPLFGDQIVDLDVGEDALHFTGAGFGVDMRLQRDGFMRLRIEAEGAGALVYYLYNASPVDDAELDGD